MRHEQRENIKLDKLLVFLNLDHFNCFYYYYSMYRINIVRIKAGIGFSILPVITMLFIRGQWVQRFRTSFSNSKENLEKNN